MDHLSLSGKIDEKGNISLLEDDEKTRREKKGSRRKKRLGNECSQRSGNRWGEGTLLISP